MVSTPHETISARQMSVLFFAFLTGSAIVNIPGPLVQFAGNGAWLSLIISGSIGLVSLACILYLHRQYPDHTYIEYAKVILGPWLGPLLAIPLVLFVFHMVSGIVLDMGLFLHSTMMKSTPLFVFHFFIMLTVAATVRAGIEVMARMFTQLTFYMLLFVVIVLVLSIPLYQPEFLLPVMPEGLKPILHGAYFTYGFPYGESFLFTMLLPAVSNNPQQSKRLGGYMFLALICNIVILILSVLCSIMTFGPVIGNIKFSLYTVARMINIQEIIQRIESIIGMALIVGSFMKAALAMYVLNMVITRIFRIQDERLLIFPIAAVSLFLTVSMFDSEIEWGEIVAYGWPLWNTASTFGPLLLLTFLTLVKGLRKKSKSDGSSN